MKCQNHDRTPMKRAFGIVESFMMLSMFFMGRPIMTKSLQFNKGTLPGYNWRLYSLQNMNLQMTLG